MTTTKRRSLPRVPTWFPVRIFREEKAIHGIALNISAGGFYMESKHKFAKNQKLILKTHLPDFGEVVVSALVVWSSKAGTKINGEFYGIGVKIIDQNQDTENILKQFADTFEGRSFKTRRMETIKVIVDGYEKLNIQRPYNFSKGGCYLLADGTLPEIGDEMNLHFHVPSLAEPLSYVAKVLYILDENQAKTLDMRPGFGVEFLEQKQGFVESLYAYLGKREEEKENGADFKN